MPKTIFSYLLLHTPAIQLISNKYIKSAVSWFIDSLSSGKKNHSNYKE